MIRYAAYHIYYNFCNPPLTLLVLRKLCHHRRLASLRSLRASRGSPLGVGSLQENIQYLAFKEEGMEGNLVTWEGRNFTSVQGRGKSCL